MGELTSQPWGSLCVIRTELAPQNWCYIFEDKRKILRMLLDKVVVKDWRVDVYYTSHSLDPHSQQSRKCQPISIYVAHVPRSDDLQNRNQSTDSAKEAFFNRHAFRPRLGSARKSLPSF